MDNLENIQEQPEFEPVADAADFLPEETTIVKIMEIENGMRKIII